MDGGESAADGPEFPTDGPEQLLKLVHRRRMLLKR
jgi:hypothetical protein